MLKGPLLHPQILSVLGRAGHGSCVLIADGNYPCRTRLGPNAELVSLNLAPGVLPVTDVLAVLLKAIPVERAAVMRPARSGPYALKTDPPIFHDFKKILQAHGQNVTLTKLERFAFYTAASTPDVCLSIATGEQRIYANLLLTIGVVR